jgi:diketogulonate reductase-like aldo/keto reductase
MDHKELGKSGVPLPEIALGTWNYKGGAEVLRQGIDLGAFFIDTAESYGSEEIVGEALRGIRERVFLATKVSPGHFKRQDLLRAADASLKRLKTDRIDLYQLHEPSFNVPLRETMAAMEELVDAGKVQFIGVSNFSLRQLRKAQSALQRHAIVSNQVRYSLADRTIEKDLLPYCQKNRITILAFSPLARGIANIQKRDRRGVLPELADATGRTAAQIALNWCISNEGVVAITKSNSIARIEEDCGASGWKLTQEQLGQLDRGIQYGRRTPMEVALRRVARRVLEGRGYW